MGMIKNANIKKKMSNQIKSTIKKLKYEDYSEDRKKAMKEIEEEKESQTDLRVFKK